ncbi:MAG: hypothetical protein ACIAQ0_04480 [Phycisphaerales bacterium JB058]
MYLQQTMPDRIDQLAGWIDYNNPNQLAMAAGAEDYGLHVDELRAVLEQNQDWITALIETTRMDTFDLYLKTRPLNAPLEPDDPRREGYLSFYRKAARILRADSIRHWSLGHREESIERVASILRLSSHIQQEEYGMLLKLVTDSILKTGIDSAFVLIDYANPPLSRQQLRPIENVLPRFDANDPCGLFASWQVQSQLGIDFLESHLADGAIDLEVDYLASGLRAIETMSMGLFEYAINPNSFQGDITAKLREEALDDVLEAVREYKTDDERYESAQMALQLARKHKPLIEQSWQDTTKLEGLRETIEHEVTEDQQYYYEIAIVGFTSFQRTNLEAVAKLRKLQELIESSSE